MSDTTEPRRPGRPRTYSAAGRASGSGTDSAKHVERGVVWDLAEATRTITGAVLAIILPDKVVEASVSGKRGGRVVSAAQDNLGGRELTAAQVQSAMAAAGIKTRLSIELDPGAPEMTIGSSVDVAGTWTHDGRYGIEEVQIVLEGQAGLRTTHTVRPILEGGSDRGAARKAPSADDKLVVGLTWNTTGTREKETLEGVSRVIISPDKSVVPAAADEAALDAEIGASP